MYIHHHTGQVGIHRLVEVGAHAQTNLYTSLFTIIIIQVLSSAQSLLSLAKASAFGHTNGLLKIFWELSIY